MRDSRIVAVTGHRVTGVAEECKRIWNNVRSTMTSLAVALRVLAAKQFHGRIRTPRLIPLPVLPIYVQAKFDRCYLKV